MKTHLRWAVYLIIASLGINGLLSHEILSSNVTPASLDIQVHAELSLQDLANNFRKAHGLAELGLDSSVVHMARAHSREMRDEHYFSHSSPFVGNESPDLRYQNVIHFKESADAPIVGENLFWMKDPGYGLNDQEIAEYAVSAFLKSPEHRENLLDPHFKKMGVGVIKKMNSSEIAEYWVTVNFVD